MRLGRSVHRDGVAQWCSKFHLEKGVRVRPLRAAPLDSRPDWVYIIGVEVRAGSGRYEDTHIVTLTPRFQIENHSSYKLEVTQRFAATGKVKCHHHALTKTGPMHAAVGRSWEFVPIFSLTSFFLSPGDKSRNKICIRTFVS